MPADREAAESSSETDDWIAWAAEPTNSTLAGQGYRAGVEQERERILAILADSAKFAHDMWVHHRDTNPFVAEYWRGAMNDMHITMNSITEGDDNDE